MAKAKIQGDKRRIAVFLSPFQRFAATEAAGGIVLLACAAIALVAANSGAREAWAHFWELPLGFSMGARSLEQPLHHWINDGLMAIFFFVVGLEIRREVLVGELSKRQQAVLPIVAALGGMVVPAAIYLALNLEGPGRDGWAIPMATDIAFALGVLALAGKRAPLSLKVFVSALAIADDIGAVLVIALFYTESVVWQPLGAAGVALVFGLAAGRLGVRSPMFYAALGAAIWVGFFASGLHSSLAGIVAALMIPTRTRIHREDFAARARALLDEFESAGQLGGSMLSNERQRVALENLEVDVERAQSPLPRLERLLHPWVAFVIIPLFALANAGVDLGAGATDVSSVSTGVVLGLLVGKPLGVVGFSLLAIRLGRASLPYGVTQRHIVGAGFLAGIGFTMSLFIATLAFAGELLVQAKVGILLGSAIAGVIGLAILWRAPLPGVPERTWDAGA